MSRNPIHPRQTPEKPGGRVYRREASGARTAEDFKQKVLSRWSTLFKIGPNFLRTKRKNSLMFRLPLQCDKAMAHVINAEVGMRAIFCPDGRNCTVVRSKREDMYFCYFLRVFFPHIIKNHQVRRKEEAAKFINSKKSSTKKTDCVALPRESVWSHNLVNAHQGI